MFPNLKISRPDIVYMNMGSAKEILTIAPK